MKISKTLLKQIIKEELQKIAETVEGKWYDEVTLRMNATDFLKLTTNEEINAYLKNRFEQEKMQYSPARAGTLFLYVDSDGTVLSHEGRNRAYANIQRFGVGSKNDVLIKVKENKLENIPYLKGQYDESAHVSIKGTPTVKQPDVKQQMEDFLETKGEALVFKAKIYPPNPYKKDETVVPGYQGALTRISIGWGNWAENYRKLNNIENFTKQQMYEFAKKYADLVNEKYKIYDSNGPLKVVDKSANIIKQVFERTPDPRDTVTIEKK